MTGDPWVTISHPPSIRVGDVRFSPSPAQSNTRLLQKLRSDLVRQEFRVRRGKGQKDRVTLLPKAAAGQPSNRLIRVKLLYDKALAVGTVGVVLPGAPARTHGDPVCLTIP